MSSILESPERQPFEWIEIDQSLCTLSYGISACQAVLGTTGADKCFKTRATCQNPDNYDGTDILTLYFCKNQGKIPDGHQYEPYLISAKLSPGVINPGGGNTSMQALGKRATLSVTLADHPHPDNTTDPYLEDRDYDPFERSTFWAKWRARNPYYLNRVIRHKSGFIDPATGQVDADTLITRTFFITNFTGPSSNNTVTIQAKDILSLAANEKAKAPSVSNGKLDADINDSVTSITLKPTGVGDEYGFSGKIRIGREVMMYTRATGSDTMTVTRAQNNTAATSHSEDDTVQECLVYTAQTPAQILEDLLVNYANVPSEYLNLSQWADEETEFLPRGYTTIITEPTGVSTLINEMCEQMYFTAFWDERVDLTASPMEGGLLMRAVRPAQDEPITYLNDDSHLLEGSIQWTDKPEEYISQVWVRYAQIDPTEKASLGTNYAATDIVADLDAESVDRNNTSKVKTVFARWLSAADGAAATELGQKILARYSHIPKECSFSLDASQGSLWLADFINVTNRNHVDFFGLPLPISMQVTSAQESIQGTTYSYTAIEYAGGTIDNEPGVFTIDISADLFNVNLLELFKEKYPSTTPISGDKIKFTIRNKVTIGGFSRESAINTVMTGVLQTYQANYRYKTGTATILINTPYLQRRIITIPRAFFVGDDYENEETAAIEGECFSDVKEVPLSTALTVGDTESGSVVWPEAWPSGVELTLVVEAGAMVIGEGGNCAPHTLDSYNSANLVRGGDGGHALNVGHPITIKNFGIIAGGGGAGSAIVARETLGFADYIVFMAGGGGAGYNNSLVSYYYTNQNASDKRDVWENNYQIPSAGEKDNNGFGINADHPDFPLLITGNGGGLGEDGESSQIGTDIKARHGLAGDAVVSGSSNITWVNKGDVRGAEN